MKAITARAARLITLAWLAVGGTAGAAEPHARHTHGEAAPAAAAVTDPSAPGTIELSPALLELLRAEMREIDAGVRLLGPAIAAGDWTAIHDTGAAIRASYLLERALTPAQVEELERALPAGFKALDADFHGRAEALAAAALQQNAALVATRYAELLRGCAACHASYAPTRFPGFAREAAPAQSAAAAPGATGRPDECIGANAVETARWLYAHRDALYGPDGPMAEVMTRELAAALRREQRCVRRNNEVCALDADLWTNAQEGVMLAPVEYEEAESGDNTAIVRVTYRFSPWEDGRGAQPATTLVRLARSNAQACWRLDDLIGAHGDSLRAQLATNP